MIYLDNAATTYPKPNRVAQQCVTAMEHYGANPGRGGHQMSLETSEQLFDARQVVSDFFHAGNPEHVVFTMNCTHALNTAIKGSVKKGCHVIISDLEHNAVARPLERLKRQGCISYSVAKVVPGNPAQTLQNFRRLIGPKTSMIVCTHVSNVFGIVLPIREIGALAKQYHLTFIVDAAQSAGVLPVDMEALQADCICAPGHKGLYGPMGTGILIARQGETMRTLIEGGTGSASMDLVQPDFMPDRFESGTVNIPGILGMQAGIEFVNETGMRVLFDHEMELTQRFYDGICKLPQVRFYTERPRFGQYAPVLSFHISGMQSEEVARLLAEDDIAVRAGFHCAPLAHKKMRTEQTGTVRVAPSAFTTEAEIDCAVASVKKIAKQLS